MKRFIRAASAGFLLAAIALPVFAEMPELHISDDAEYRNSQLFKERREAEAMRYASRGPRPRPSYLSAPRHISDDAEYRNSQLFKERREAEAMRYASHGPRPRPSYLSAPRHISDDDE